MISDLQELGLAPSGVRQRRPVRTAHNKNLSYIVHIPTRSVLVARISAGHIIFHQHIISNLQEELES
jgi:polysaccharide deacetylase 2 family uncharacterized protein YibQ